VRVAVSACVTKSLPRTATRLGAAVFAGLSLAACSIAVDDLVDPQETGLPGYPGARLVRDSDGPESAKVDFNTSLFGVNLVAAKYRTDNTPEAVLDFYRHAMKTYGAVTECRGDIDFKGRGGKTAVCDPKSGSDDVQLVTGTQDDQRIVAVKPRGAGAEFALVHVRTRD
jgi:hypothetical protein